MSTDGAGTGQGRSRALRLPRPSWLSPQAEAVVSFAAVGGSMVFVLFQLHPELLVAKTTTAGGDMGAHVWGPDFMRRSLLPRWRLTGWAPDWYAGFPAYTFYFPLPALLIVLLSVVIPYEVAFKLVSVLGLLALPVAAWAFGRLAGLPFPVPPVLALATVPFLFDRGWNIYGGNIASTMAGEFSFSISLALALLFLGVVARGLDTGRHRALAAGLLAVTGLSHILPTLFAMAGAAVLLALQPGRRRAWWLFTAGAVGGLLAAFWWLPFWRALPYANDMGWEKVVEYQENLVRPYLLWLPGLALAGLVSAVVFARRAGLALAGIALVAAAAFRFAPEGRLWNARFLPFWYLCLYLLAGLAVAEAIAAVGWLLKREPGSPPRRYATAVGAVGATVVALLHGRGLMDLQDVLPGGLRWLVALAAAGLACGAALRRRPALVLFGLPVVAAVVTRFGDPTDLWDARALPAWVLALYLGSGLALAAGATALGRLLEPVGARLAPSVGRFGSPVRLAGLTAPVVTALAVYLVVGLQLNILPGNLEKALSTKVSEDASKISLTFWAEWNYEGYERKDSWPEHQDLIATMGRVGRTHGCGRVHWEYEAGIDRFGTPLALMVLPYWTRGCIASMEGLYFESSATTPYHFLNAGELSKAPSNPQRDLPYRSLQSGFEEGVRHLQLMGVRYYVAFSQEALARARAHPDLREVDRTRPWAAQGHTNPLVWHVFEVAGSDLVTPLPYQPAVLRGLPPGNRPWLDVAVNWYQDSSGWDVPLAADGPSTWPRVRVHRRPPPTRTVQGRKEAFLDGKWEPAPPLVGLGTTVDPPPRRSVPAARVSRIRTGDDRISFDVDRPGSPVLVKASYFPNWQASGARGPWRVTPNLMVVVPTARHVTLHYGRTAADWAGLALSLLGVALLVVLARRPLGERPPPADVAADDDRAVQEVEAPADVPAGVTARGDGSR